MRDRRRPANLAEQQHLHLEVAAVSRDLEHVADAYLASGLRSREHEWEILKRAEDKALASRDAELADLERRQSRLKEVNEAIERKIAYVEDRSHRCVHLPELEAVAIKAVLDGYNAGIAENLGRLRGAAGRSL